MLELCKPLYEERFFVTGKCSHCPFSFSGPVRTDTQLTLLDVVPRGLCPHVYYSMIPYWVSFLMGASFPWRMDRDDVNCQCMKTTGAAFIVKRTKVSITATLDHPNECPLPYEGKVEFVLSDWILCPALFPALYSLSGMPTCATELPCCVSAAARVNIQRA